MLGHWKGFIVSQRAKGGQKRVGVIWRREEGGGGGTEENMSEVEEGEGRCRRGEGREGRGKKERKEGGSSEVKKRERGSGRVCTHTHAERSMLSIW